MTTVNTNLAALSALKNIDSTDKSMSKAMEKLSSDLRINSADAVVQQLLKWDPVDLCC